MKFSEVVRLLEQHGFRLVKEKGSIMIRMKYSLVIEATRDPNFFGFFSPDLEGFTGVGHSIEDCVYKAQHGMDEHLSLLPEQGIPVPSPPARPLIVIQNEAEERAKTHPRSRRHHTSIRGAG